GGEDQAVGQPFRRRGRSVGAQYELEHGSLLPRAEGEAAPQPELRGHDYRRGPANDRIPAGPPGRQPRLRGGYSCPRRRHAGALLRSPVSSLSEETRRSAPVLRDVGRQRGAYEQTVARVSPIAGGR